MSDEIRKKNWILCVCPLCPCQLSVCGKLFLCYHWSVFLLFSVAESLWGLSFCRHTGSIFYLYTGAELQLFPLKYGKYIRVSVIRPCSNQVAFSWPLNEPLQETPGGAGNSWGCASSGVMGGWRHWAPREGNGKCHLPLSLPSQLSSHRCSAMVMAQGTWAPGTVHSYRLDPSLFALFSSG